MNLPRIIIYKDKKFRLQSNGRYYQAHSKKVKERLLHRLIWSDANGDIPEGYCVHHKNHDWTDNRLENLELKSISDHQRDHVLERMEDPEYRAKQKEWLEKGQQAAKEWHSSPEGIAWHKEHGKRTWEGREPVDAVCTVCKSEYKTHSPTRSRFCSTSCEKKEGYQRHKTARGDCKLCGKEFYFNKYRKQECCSRTCSNRLRHVT